MKRVRTSEYRKAVMREQKRLMAERAQQEEQKREGRLKPLGTIGRLGFFVMMHNLFTGGRN